MSQLVTLARYNTLTPEQQGYCVYMQSSHEGSELHGQTNPYPADSAEDVAWKRGELIGVLEAQDSEE